MFKSFLLVFALLLTALCPQGHLHCSAEYEYNPRVAIEQWDRFSRHFLPHESPIREQLDAIFSATGDRVIENSKTLKKAGFAVLQSGNWRSPYVLSHSSLPGHLVKLYTHSQNVKRAEERLYNRVEGANLIQILLDQHECNHLFKVARKWLYPLKSAPPRTAKKSHQAPKHFILVVEDLHLVEPHHDREDREQHEAGERPVTPRELIRALARHVRPSPLAVTSRLSESGPWLSKRLVS